MACARGRISPIIQNILRSEMERVIEQANLGEENTRIARMYYVERIPQIDIAEEIGVERSTISRRLSSFAAKIEMTAHRIGYFT